MVQRDYLLRLIERFIAAVARIAGLAREGRLDAARQELEDAYRELGVSRSLVATLDDGSVRLLIGDDKSRVLALLFGGEAAIARSEGHEPLARMWEARAARLGADDLPSKS